jgi:hypothetical protein
VFGLPDTEADADNMLKLKITADSYSFCPKLMLNSTQLLRTFPSARLLPSRLLPAALLCFNLMPQKTNTGCLNPKSPDKYLQAAVATNQKC